MTEINLPDFRPLTAAFRPIGRVTADFSRTLREWTELARLAQGEPMNDDDAMIARNRRLAANIAAGTDVCTLDEVIDSIRKMGSANVDVPGPRAVQLVDEIKRLRGLLDEPDPRNPS